MRRSTLILLLILAALSLAPVVVAQEAKTVDVVKTVVLPRLEEYGAKLPPKYGTLKLEEFQELLAEKEVTILDVREEAEVKDTGVIEGTINIPLRTLAANLSLLPDLDSPIVVVCKGGFRGTIGMTVLQILGYTDVKVLVGGFDAWIGEDLPVVAEPAQPAASKVPEKIDPVLLEHVANYLATLPKGWGAVQAKDLFEQLVETPPDYLLDVRSEKEWNDPGHIESAQWLWIDEFVKRQDEWPKELDAKIVVYCGTSYRAGVVSVMLGLMGYTDVRNLAGGITAWIAADLPVIK